MPPFKDDDTRVLTGFDLQTASTLYWKAIPVLLKHHDREDQTEQLTFRILSGVTRQNHNLRVRSGRRRTVGGPQAAPRSARRVLLLLHAVSRKVGDKTPLCPLLDSPLPAPGSAHPCV
jgi:hypothetical protein